MRLLGLRLRVLTLLAFISIGFNAQNTASMTNYALKHFMTDDLVVYDITDCRLQLACGIMPDTLDRSVVLCVAAAFTGVCLHRFEHSNILGLHVSDGKLFEGYEETPEHYAFFADLPDPNGKNASEKLICAHPSSNLLCNIQRAGGMGFTQYWVIKNGDIYIPKRQDKKVEYYRCIAQKDARWYVLESKEKLNYDQFLSALVTFGVENALYLDMGRGWNHSFYRDEMGNLYILHPYTHPYCTNWLVVM